MQVQIKGPATVKDLKVEAKIPGSEERGYSNSSETSVKSTGGETTRNLRINASTFDGSGAKSAGPFHLLIRYPQDLKRERVNFKLKGLDLL